MPGYTFRRLCSFLVNRDYWYFDEHTCNQVSDYFNDLTLQEMVLMPNEVYQGVLFFKAVELYKVYRDDSTFSVTSLYPTPNNR